MARPMIVERRQFIRNGALLAAGALLPQAAGAQWAEIHELAGEVRLDGRRIARNAAIQAGQTLATGGDGRIWFSLAGDAYFLRPGSELRLQGFPGRDKLIEVLRLVTGALGATFARGPRRSVVAGTVTVGIRGTGVYVETSAAETYACTCFGATELNGLTVSATHHSARLLRRGETQPQEAPLERHSSEEMGRLESLVGRPYPFRP